MMLWRNTALPWLPWVMIAVSAVAMTLIPLFVILGEAAPMYYLNSPFPVLRDPVHAGDNLPLLIGRCNRLETPLVYNFVRTMVPVDGPPLLPVAMLPSGSLLPPGCETVDSQLNPIPQFAPPGRYYITGVTVVHGQWREFSIPWETEPFTIEGRERGQ